MCCNQVIKVTLSSKSYQSGLQTDELCHHGGHCVNTGNSHYCKCPADYTGSYCKSQVDHCEDKPCHNGATCRGYVGGYQCDVSPLSMLRSSLSDTRRLSIHMVLPHNCGGYVIVICVSLQCMPGYTGKNCEIEINECQSHPCQNGGTCIDLVGHYICSCPPGTLGMQAHIQQKPVFTTKKKLTICD